MLSFLSLLSVALAAPTLDDPAVAAQLSACGSGDGAACAALAEAWLPHHVGRAERLWWAACRAEDLPSCRALAAGFDPVDASDLYQSTPQGWIDLRAACDEGVGAACVAASEVGPYAGDALRMLGVACGEGLAHACHALDDSGLVGPDWTLTRMWSTQRGTAELAGPGRLVHTRQPATRSEAHRIRVPKDQEDFSCGRASRNGRTVFAAGSYQCASGGVLFAVDAESLEEQAAWQLRGTPDHLLLSPTGEALVSVAGAFARYRVGSEEPEPVELPRVFRTRTDPDSRFALAWLALDTPDPWRLALLDTSTAALTLIDADAMAGGETWSSFEVQDGIAVIATSQRILLVDVTTGELSRPPIVGAPSCEDTALFEHSWLMCETARTVSMLQIAPAEPLTWTLERTAPAPEPEGATAADRDAPRTWEGTVNARSLPFDGVEAVLIDGTGIVARAPIDPEAMTFAVASPPGWREAVQLRGPGVRSDTLDIGRSLRGLNATLERSRDLVVTVADASGKPVADAWVVAARPDKANWAQFVDEGRTDAEGQVTLTGVRGDALRILARGPGTLLALGDAGAETSALNVSLAPADPKTATARRFVSDAGEPVAGVRPMWGDWAMLHSDGDGWLVIPRPIEDKGRGQSYRIGEGTLVWPDVGAVEIPVGTGAIAVARPDLYRDAQLEMPEYAIIDASGGRERSTREVDGVLHFEGVAAGEWVVLSAHTNDRPSPDGTTFLDIDRSAVDIVTVEAGKSVAVDPSWSDAVARGRVLSADGWPAAGAWVSTPCVQHVEGFDLELAFSRCADETDVTGAFELLGLAGTRWKLTASRGDEVAQPVVVESLDEPVELRLGGRP